MFKLAGEGLGQTPQQNIQTSITQMGDTLKNIVWWIIVIALVALVWMYLKN